MGEEMQIEKRMQKILDKITKTIQVETDIVNSDGIIVASSDKSRIGQQDAFIKADVTADEKISIYFSGRTYIKFNANSKSRVLFINGWELVGLSETIVF